MPFENAAHKIAHSELTYGRKLGEGSFGEVFEGSWQHSVVAIKKLKMQNLSEDAAHELETEADIMAGLRHDNIVGFRGFCYESPHYAIVMEYLPMGSLYQLLHSNQDIDWQTRVQISLGSGAGLVYLHSKDILHRDIKSLNILVEEKHGTLHGKLTDFGLSKIKTDTVASSNAKSFSGTLAWMAPELFDDESYQKASDVYSFAVVLWEIASRNIPFANAKTPAAIIGQILRGNREKIPEETPEQFKQAIESGWQQLPAERPAAEQIVIGLRLLLESFPKQGQTPNLAEVPGSIAASQLSLKSPSLGLQGNFASIIGDRANQTNFAEQPNQAPSPIPDPQFFQPPPKLSNPSLQGNVVSGNAPSPLPDRDRISDARSLQALIARREQEARGLIVRERVTEESTAKAQSVAEPQRSINTEASNFLFAAAASGDVDLIKEILKMTPPDEVKNTEGKTPLHVAVQHNQHDAIRFLCANGADPRTCVWYISAKAPTKTNALGIAFQYSDMETVSLLLNLSKANELNFTYQALSCLARNDPEKSVTIFRRVVQNSGVDYSKLLRECVGQDNRLLFEELVSKKAFLTNVLLYVAVCCGHEALFDRLIELGFDPNPVSKKKVNRWNLLFAVTLPENFDRDTDGIPDDLHDFAVVRQITPDHVNIARKLLDAGIDVNSIRRISDLYGKCDFSILNQAVLQQERIGNDLLVKLFLERGANPRQKLVIDEGLGRHKFYAGLGKHTDRQDQEKAIAAFETRYAEQIAQGKRYLEENGAVPRNNCVMS